MNTESSYIYQEPTEGQGLGRMPARPTMPGRDSDEAIPRTRSQLLRSPVQPRPIAKPRSMIVPQPVIDKNPVGAPPKLIINTVKKPSSQQSQTATKSKPTRKQQPISHKEILTGTFAIGGIQVTKTHAAMAAGGIAGGVLLWKILF